MEEKMKLRKKHVAIILALGMVLTSTGPILADQVTSPGVETVSSDPKPKDTNKSEIIVSPDVQDPKLDPNSSLAKFLSSDQTSMRISGPGRVETSIEISRFENTKSKTVILADARNYPDALAASNLTGGRYSVILVQNQLTQEIINETVRLEAQDLIILGGTNSISEDIERGLANIGGIKNISRIAGENRYDTCQKIFNHAKKKSLILASGENFPDALAASTLAQKIEAPILLVSKDKIDQSVIDYFKNHNIKKVLVAGGQLSISDKTLANADRLIRGLDPIDNQGPQKPQPEPKPEVKPEEPKTIGRIINPVPYVSQLKPVYAPNGCEATSLLMGLKGKGYTNLGLRAFLDNMPKTSSNPAKGYVGSPYGNENYRFLTIDPEPLAKYGQRYGNVVNIQGAPIEDIIKEIQNGNTVVIYVTLHWAPAYYKTLPIDGVPTRRIFNNHVLLLTGYDPAKKAFYIADPYNHESDGANRSKPFFYWKSQALVDKCYNYGNRRFAVAIR